jgi:hypothetical protein
MAKRKDVDRILADWNFDPFSLNVRKCEGSDGREILQMRIDMGVMQMETTGRPDGATPGGYRTMLEWMQHKAVDQTASGKDPLGEETEFQLTEDNCLEIDREFVQFYHRRICWLHLHDYANAVLDADHTLALMDFCRDHSKDEQWTVSHEQYRPFVLFHRTQAAALAALESTEGAEASIQAINQGLTRMRDIYVHYDVEEQFEEEELVKRLKEMREELREKYKIGQTLQERLDDAVQTEQYELAAQLRDELAKRLPGQF